MQYASDPRVEKKTLAQLVQKLRGALRYYHDLNVQTVEELVQLHAMYGTDQPEFYNDIPAKEFLQALYERRENETQRAIGQPYFGKLVYAEQGDAEQSGVADTTIYIGKKGISNYRDHEELWVIDWRAPVSQLYYRGNLGKTSYDAPRETREVDLKLKTTLEIENSRLLGLYDSEVVANDDLLVKYLSKNKDVVLNEIVATIQEDQDRIIRKPLRVNVVVQGVAGSGKTTVALHRVAYLLYEYREELEGESVYVLAANRLFLNYITSMLPDLDVPAVCQGTLAQLLETQLQKRLPTLRFRVNVLDSDYALPDILPRLQAFVQAVKTQTFANEVALHDVVFWSKQEVVTQLDGLHEMTFTRLAQLMDKRLALFYKNNETAFSLPLHDSLFRQGITLKQDVDKQMAKVRTQLMQWYRRGVKRLRPQELLQGFRQSLGLGTRRPADYTLDDLCILALFANWIDEGCDMPEIRQVVVDEAQDLSALQYHCIRSIFRNATFTIVGDVMQNITPNTLGSWEEVIEQVFGGKAEYETLLKSYRNTIEISDFAKRIVEHSTKEPFATQPLVRHGDPVALLDVPPPQKLQTLLALLARLQQAEYGLHAVICKDAKTAQALYKSVQGQADVQWMDAQSDTLTLGTYILSAADAKGLEFDCVVIWDFDDYDLEPPACGEFKRLYVAATRALHELYVFTQNPEFLRSPAKR